MTHMVAAANQWHIVPRTLAALARVVGKPAWSPRCMSGKTAAITNCSEVAVASPGIAESAFARAVRAASEMRVVFQLSRGMAAVVAFEARNGSFISTAIATVLLR